MQSVSTMAKRVIPEQRPQRGLRASDWLLDADREPPIGAQLLTPRRGYTHHGIYVGRGCVVHYRGLSSALSRGPVEEVSLCQFARGAAVWVRVEERPFASREEVVRRARERLGENRYRLFTNNCEHFCEWCIRGQPRSYQVDEMIGSCLRALLSLKELAMLTTTVFILATRALSRLLRIPENWPQCYRLAVTVAVERRSVPVARRQCSGRPDRRHM
jgi:hypothetical protein